MAVTNNNIKQKQTKKWGYARRAFITFLYYTRVKNKLIIKKKQFLGVISLVVNWIDFFFKCYLNGC